MRDELLSRPLEGSVGLAAPLGEDARDLAFGTERGRAGPAILEGVEHVGLELDHALVERDQARPVLRRAKTARDAEERSDAPGRIARRRSSFPIASHRLGVPARGLAAFPEREEEPPGGRADALGD